MVKAISVDANAQLQKKKPIHYKESFIIAENQFKFDIYDRTSS